MTTTPNRHYIINLLAVVSALIVIGASSAAHAADKKTTPRSNSIFATGPADGGRLIIKRSPVLGYNVSISVWIDGKVAGTLARAQTFDRYITPGRHVLHAAPTNMGSDWTGTLDVRAGQTKVLIASYSVGRLVLALPSSSW